MRFLHLISVPLLLGATMVEAEDQVVPGSLLIASGEGISVFNRHGEMAFGKFFVPMVNGKGEATPWSDIGYDGCRLPSGHFLCSSHEWVREIAPDGKIVWEYRAQKPVELKTCVPLLNGEVVTTDASKQELVWLKKGQEVKRVPVPSKMQAAPHSRYNLLRRTPAGTFLLAMRAEKAFIEIDESGKELWRHPVPDLPVVAERLANGNTLMSWRGGLLEVNPNHELVWELKAADIEDFKVLIFGGFHRFENGNTLIANSDWHYHDAKEAAVQLFEVTRDKKVVWKLGVEAFAGKKPGSLEPKTGNIEHRIIGIQWLGEDRK